MKTPYDIHWLTRQFESGNVLKFIFFWGHTSDSNEEVGKFCLSQWFDCPFTVGDITYNTTEHWMMACKAWLFGDKNNFEKIIHCKKPGEAKDLGRQVLGYDDQIWNEKKVDIVKVGNIHKFNQHPLLAEYLLKTENRILVEASPIDRIWGIGLAQDSNDLENIYAWRGQNLLGFALMEVRDFLKTFGHFKPLDNSMPAPWTKFPAIGNGDAFWQSGQGSDYLAAFDQYFQRLTEREQTIYQLTNPEPFAWAGFYG